MCIPVVFFSLLILNFYQYCRFEVTATARCSSSSSNVVARTRHIICFRTIITRVDEVYKIIVCTTIRVYTRARALSFRMAGENMLAFSAYHTYIFFYFLRYQFYLAAKSARACRRGRCLPPAGDGGRKVLFSPTIQNDLCYRFFSCRYKSDRQTGSYRLEKKLIFIPIKT